MKITFAEEGWSEYLYWQTQDKKILKRINQLLQSIERDGALHGIGKPEPLKYGKSGSFSRRIDWCRQKRWFAGIGRVVVNINGGF